MPAVLEPGELTREAIEQLSSSSRDSTRASTLDQARREAAALAKRLGELYIAWNAGAGFTVDSMLDDAVRDVRPALSSPARRGLVPAAHRVREPVESVRRASTARSGEFAVRLALGASRARLIAQAIAEAVPVLVLGGVLGVAVAEWAVRAFVANAPAGLPRVESIALSAPVVAFSLALLVLTGLAASIAPAVAGVGDPTSRRSRKTEDARRRPGAGARRRGASASPCRSRSRFRCSSARAC